MKAITPSAVPFPPGYRPQLCTPCDQGIRHDLCQGRGCHCLQCHYVATLRAALASTDPWARMWSDLEFQRMDRRAKPRMPTERTASMCGHTYLGTRPRKWCSANKCRLRYLRMMERQAREAQLMAQSADDARKATSDWWAARDGGTPDP